ncbi:glutathione S-transferase [Limibaculum sp. M0105]|uniref:Glutathione S-transferase n=1 Tax=Thermohalobaculum xanthum TaxID=2753746 RepID=A0A8J7M8Q2_9RHOB|nr:glutathione S-transferase [Thermohalobaculum xanthum]MBK0400676.1 glutathione S-transferase [Thermohalobaculum xanthum]
MTGKPDIADCVNETCPWSGKPVSPDALALYRGRVVGFCNPGCRNKFETAVAQFDALIGTPAGSE